MPPAPKHNHRGPDEGRADCHHDADPRQAERLELQRRVAMGDESAWSTLHTQHWDRTVSHVQKATRRFEHDIAVDACLKAWDYFWEHGKAGTLPVPFLPLLYRRCRWRMKDELDKRRREGKENNDLRLLSRSDLTAPLPDLPANTSPVEEAFAALTRREQDVLRLALQGMRSAEIARRLGICVDRVSELRSQAYRKLRRRFEHPPAGWFEGIERWLSSWMRRGP